MPDPARPLKLREASALPGTLSADEAELAVEAARQLFQRTLAAWACDLLALRKAGLDRPGWLAEPPEAPDLAWPEAA